MFGDAVVDTHRRLMSNSQPTHLAPQQMLEWSFEEAVKQFAIKNTMNNNNLASASTMTQPYLVSRDPNPVSDTAGKELWQFLAQKCGGPPPLLKTADSDSEKSDVTKSVSKESKVGRDGSESGDGSCNTSVASKQSNRLATVARALENGAGDATKSTASNVTTVLEVPLSGWAGWRAVDQAASPEDEPDAEESFRTLLDCTGSNGSGLVDANDVSGEESFYSVTSNGPMTPAAAALNDDDDDDNTENSDASADADDDGATAKQAPAETGRSIEHVDCSSSVLFSIIVIIS